MWFCHKNSTSSHKKAAATSYALIYLFLGVLARRRKSCRDCCATKIQDVIFANFSPTLSLCPLGAGRPCVATLHTIHFTLYVHYTLHRVCLRVTVYTPPTSSTNIYTLGHFLCQHTRYTAQILHTNLGPLSPCVVCGWLAVTARTEAAFITETIPGMLIVDNRSPGWRVSGSGIE